MRYAELTRYQQSRFGAYCNCKICGQEITHNQEFEMVIVRSSKSKIYSFMHTDCLQYRRVRIAEEAERSYND